MKDEERVFRILATSLLVLVLSFSGCAESKPPSSKLPPVINIATFPVGRPQQVCDEALARSLTTRLKVTVKALSFETDKARYESLTKGESLIVDNTPGDVYWDEPERPPLPVRFVWLSDIIPGGHYMLFSLSGVADDIIYQIVKAIDETYPEWKDAVTPDSRFRTLAGTLYLGYSPTAYHAGLVRYARELGKWTPEHEAYQAAALKAEEERIAAWQAKWGGPIAGK